MMRILVSRWTLGTCLVSLLMGCSDKQEPHEHVEHAANGSTYVAMARGKVEVQGGLLEIKASQSGRLAHLAVTEGDKVEHGAELAKLDDHGTLLELKTSEAELELAQARQDATAQRLPAARQLAQRLQQAARLGASDAQRADDALQQQQQLESELTIAKAEVSIAHQHVAQAKEHLAERTLLAPQAATVVKVNATIGARISAEDTKPLMVLLPDRPLQVRAELNEGFVARIKPGMPADIVLESTPDQAALKAHVVQIGTVFGSSHGDDDNQIHSNVRVVDCLLAFDQAPTLRIGQNVRVNFHE